MKIFKISFDKDDVLSFILCNRFQAASRDRSVLTSRDERMISAWVHSDPDLSRLNFVRQSSWLNLYNNFHNFNNCSDKKGHPRQKWKFGENFNAINFHWNLSSKFCHLNFFDEKIYDLQKKTDDMMTSWIMSHQVRLYKTCWLKGLDKK